MHSVAYGFNGKLHANALSIQLLVGQFPHTLFVVIGSVSAVSWHEVDSN